MTTMLQDRELSQLVVRRVMRATEDISFDTEFIVEWVSKNLSPDDVFTTGDLRAWALSNGFVEE